MKRILSLLLACAVSTAASRADTAEAARLPEHLDLKAAIRFALDNSFAIREARERIKQQDGVLVQVRASELPGLNAAGPATGAAVPAAPALPPPPTCSNAWRVAASEEMTAAGSGSPAVACVERGG